MPSRPIDNGRVPSPAEAGAHRAVLRSGDRSNRYIDGVLQPVGPFVRAEVAVAVGDEGDRDAGVRVDPGGAAGATEMAVAAG
jgi:hypothetical protein